MKQNILVVDYLNYHSKIFLNPYQIDVINIDDLLYLLNEFQFHLNNKNKNLKYFPNNFECH